MGLPAIGIYFLYFALSTPDSQFCDLETRTASCSLKDSQPVCAVYSGENCFSETGLCTKTITNSCLACNDDTVISYVPGECEDPQVPHVCTDFQREISCSTDKKTVCGYASSLRFGREKVYSQEYENGCEACNPIHIKFHIPGKCQDPNTLRICQKKQKNTECEGSGPSCAYYTDKDCKTKVCRKTVQNACSVCDDSSILFHIDGACNNQNEVEEIVSNEDSGESQEFILERDGVVLYQEIHKSRHAKIPIAQIDTLLLPDGSELIIRDEPHCEVPVQEDIPLLEEVVQPDGSVIFERVERSSKEKIQKENEDPEQEKEVKNYPIEAIDSRLLARDKNN